MAVREKAARPGTADRCAARGSGAPGAGGLNGAGADVHAGHPALYRASQPAAAACGNGVYSRAVTAMAALVLAGGRARRMQGVDKAALQVAGTPLLDRVIGACSGLPVVVVGPAAQHRASGHLHS